MTTAERTKLVAFHEAEVARLQGEVRAGNMNKLGEYAMALGRHRAAELGVELPIPDCPELDHQVETPQAPQVQCDKEYILFLEARANRLKSAIAEACYWLDCKSPGRAYGTLQQALTS